MLAAALHRLGFRDLHPLRPWTQVRRGPLALTPTPTAGDFPEVGLLLQDGGASVFHQVDTPIHAQAVQRLRGLAPALDLHLARYASQAFGWFDGVPEDLATTHGRNVQAARLLGARAVVPSSAGFRFVDAHDRLNAQLLPTPRARAPTRSRQPVPSWSSGACSRRSAPPGTTTRCCAPSATSRPATCCAWCCPGAAIGAGAWTCRAPRRAWTRERRRTAPS